MVPCDFCPPVIEEQKGQLRGISEETTQQTKIEEWENFFSLFFFLWFEKWYKLGTGEREKKKMWIRWKKRAAVQKPSHVSALMSPREPGSKVTSFPSSAGGDNRLRYWYSWVFTFCLSKQHGSSCARQPCYGAVFLNPGANRNTANPSEEKNWQIFFFLLMLRWKSLPRSFQK